MMMKQRREKEEKLRLRDHLHGYLSSLLMVRHPIKTIKKDGEDLTKDKRSVRRQTDMKIISRELIKILYECYIAWGNIEQSRMIASQE